MSRKIHSANEFHTPNDLPFISGDAIYDYRQITKFAIEAHHTHPAALASSATDCQNTQPTKRLGNPQSPDACRLFTPALNVALGQVCAVLKRLADNLQSLGALAHAHLCVTAYPVGRIRNGDLLNVAKLAKSSARKPLADAWAIERDSFSGFMTTPSEDGGRTRRCAKSQ